MDYDKICPHCMMENITKEGTCSHCGRDMKTDSDLHHLKPYTILQGKLSTIRLIISSLQQVHDKGVIHRDISPDNIILMPEGNMKLIDFGAARSFNDAEANKSLSVMLKPGYAPEEQYRTHGDQGPWSDVYALAATIYKCLSGVTPVESMERMRDYPLKSLQELGIRKTLRLRSPR